MSDIRDVGEKKILGYLPLATISDICGEDPLAIEIESQSRGLRTLYLSEAECSVYTGALYVYDHDGLQAFLNHPNNKKILEEHDFPVCADTFVEKIASKMVCYDRQRPLYDLIALAFHDPREEYQSYIPKPNGPVPFTFG